jgi:hypothetical protein
MLIARRLYVYFIAVVGLAMAAAGVAHLLALGSARVYQALGGAATQQSSESVRRDLSLYVALVIVALPVWLLHWWLAERARHRTDPDGERERASSIRALYLTFVLAVTFVVIFNSCIDLIIRLLAVFFRPPVSYEDPRGIWLPIAELLVALIVHVYHVRIRLRDERGGPLEGPSNWLPRLYVYGAAFTGAMLFLFSFTDLIRLVVDVVFGSNLSQIGGRWWADPLTTHTAPALVGLAIWGLFWSFSLRTLRRSDWLGDSERRASLRWLYLYAIVFIGVLFTIIDINSSLVALLRLILSVPRNVGQESSTRAILDPLLQTVPFVAVWLYHRFVVLGADSAQARTPGAESVRRLYTYLVACLWLALAGFGSAAVLSILIDLLLGGSRTQSVSSLVWRSDFARFSAYVLVGVAAWLWQWREAQRRAADDVRTERVATTRRIYLYLTLAATLVALLISLALIVYRVISVVLGVHAGSGFASAMSRPLGVVIIAGALFAYHLTVLRRDLALLAETQSGTLTVSLTLTLPRGADIDATVSTLREQLPEGYALALNRPPTQTVQLPTAIERPDGDDAQAAIVGVP